MITNLKKYSRLLVLTKIALFAIYNVYWLIFSYIRWKPLCDAVGYDERYEDYVKFVGEIDTYDRYIYHTALPGYLRFGGNLSLSQTAVKGSTRPTVDLLIFPEIGGYRVETQIIFNKTDEKETTMETGGTITLNEHMEFYGEPTEEEKELFEKYKPEIQHTFDKMREVWNLE